MPKNTITPGDVRNCGFSMIELMVVVAMLAVLASVAIPEMSKLIKNAKLKTATRQLVSSLQEMKFRAIKENATTVMIIDEANDKYTAFLDNNPANWALDGSENIIAQIDLQSDDLEITSTSLNKTLGFNGRGLLSFGAGTITITNATGRQKQVVINFMGNIRAE
jgi:type IV fimbrial biogenesis protein FimT